MPQLTLILGLLLILLGAGGYLGTGTESVTALIPTFFGVPFVLLGLLARKDNLRMHAMHVASLLALLGLIGALVRPARKLFAGELSFSTALASQAAMALLCGAFLVLCIKSFVDARLRRKDRPDVKA